MSAPVTTEWQWPADVLAFAAAKDVQAYLEPLREATLRLFPRALWLKVQLVDDPSIPDLQQIVFHAKVPRQDIPNFVDALHSWNHELDRCCPRLLSHHFCFILDPAAE